MAIRIPSANISERKSAKILKNKINSVAYTENNLVGSIQSVFSSSFSIYSSNTGSYTYFISDYTDNISQNEYLPTATDRYCSIDSYQHHYCYFEIKNIKYPSLVRKESLSLSVEQKGTDEVLNEGIVSLNYKNAVGVNSNSTYLLKTYDNIDAFREETFYGAHLGSIGNVIDFSGYVKVGVVLRDYDFDILILLKTYEKNSSGSYYRIQQSYGISFALKVYNKTSENKGATDNAGFTLETNELLSSSTKIIDTSIGSALSNKIVEEYSMGKQTATVLCAMTDYYDYDSGEEIIGANNYQLLNADKWIEKWNANYESGKVTQIEADGSPSVYIKLNDYLEDDGTFNAILDKPMYSSLKDGDEVTLKYKVNGVENTLQTYVLDYKDGAQVLTTIKGSMDGAYIILLNDDEVYGTVFGNIFINATFTSSAEVIDVGNSAQLRFVIFNETSIPTIEIEIQADIYTFQLQTYETYPNIITEKTKTIASNSLIYFTFVKNSDFNYIRFKLNGKNQDTGISFDVSDLENGKTYCFSAKVNVSDGQGNIYWEDMMLNHGARPSKHQEYLPMTFAVYDEVIPMVRSYDGNDYPMSLNADGTPKVFRVLGLDVFYDGAVWQKLSLQEC